MRTAGSDWRATTPCRGGAGDDFIDGGVDRDTANYTDSSVGVTVSLLLQGAAQNTGNGMDTLVGFESLWGSGHGDSLTGDAAANNLLGQAGDDALFGLEESDFLTGGFGNDLIDGGAGEDYALYLEATSGVTVSLGLQGAAQNTGVTGLDTLVSIERLVGSQFDDVLTGDGGDNGFVGAGGRDLISGGGGIDWASYSGATSGVTVSLLNKKYQDTVGAGFDMLVSIESLFGSALNDSLTGDKRNNILGGGPGDDVLDGGAGLDLVYYGSDLASSGVIVSLLQQGIAQDTLGAGLDIFVGFEGITGSRFNDDLNGDDATNQLNGWGGADILRGGGGDDRIQGDFFSGMSVVETGLAGDDQLFGEDGADTLIGGAGDDLLDGGADLDTADFSGATLAMTVDLGAGTAVGEGSDSLVSIENVIGSDQNDLLTGDGQANVLRGGGGKDQLTGGAGDDQLQGDNGIDLLIGGTGSDRLTGGTGGDSFVIQQASIGPSSLNALREKDQLLDLSFAGGDRIDLSGIDANTALAGDQAFSFVAAFTSQAGQATLIFSAATGKTTLSLDVDGDGKQDYQMLITGDVSASTGDLSTGPNDGGWLL